MVFPLSRRRLLSTMGPAGLALCLASPARSQGAGLRGVAFAGQVVSDLDRTTRFYQALGGLEVLWERPIDPAIVALEQGRSGGRMRMLSGGGGKICLMAFSDPSPQARAARPVPVQGGGLTHICHQAPHDNGIWGRVLGEGARAVSRTGGLVQLRSDVPVLYGYARDSDGTMLEVEHIMTPGPGWSYRMSHVAMAIADIERSVRFYTALFGRAPRERRRSLSSATLDVTADLDRVVLDVAWFNPGGIELEIWQYVSHPPAIEDDRPVAALGYNMVVYDVVDAAAALGALAAAGGRPVSAAAPGGALGGRIAFGRDPDGVLIGFAEA